MQSSKLYHLGFRSPVARNTLANANATRDWRIYCDLAQSLIGTARRLYADEAFGLDLKDTVYALDAPRSICVARSFPGRRSARPKRGQTAHAVGFAGQYSVLHLHQRRQAARRQYSRSVGARAGAIYVIGRGYIDFDRLGRFHEAGSFFVIRAKTNLKAERRHSHAVDRSTGLVCDQTVTLTAFYSQKGLILDSPNRDFGGVSGFRVMAGDEYFLAVTDKGHWIRGRIVYRNQIPIAIADAVVAPILGPDGRALKPRGWYDAEALAVEDGIAYVTIERVNQIVRFDTTKDGLSALGRPMAVSPGLKLLPSNQGIECLEMAPKGSPRASTLIAISERGLDPTAISKAFWSARLAASSRSSAPTISRR